MEKSDTLEFFISSCEKQNKMYRESNGLFQTRSTDDGGKARSQRHRRARVSGTRKNDSRMVQTEDKWPRSWWLRHQPSYPFPGSPNTSQGHSSGHIQVCPGTPRHEVLTKCAQVASQMFTSPTAHSSVCHPKPDCNQSQLGCPVSCHPHWEGFEKEWAQL